MAAKTTIVQADSLVSAGDIDPEVVVTPGIYVNRLVAVGEPLQESAMVASDVSYP